MEEKVVEKLKKNVKKNVWALERQCASVSKREHRMKRKVSWEI